jgi:hypothetical protein
MDRLTARAVASALLLAGLLGGCARAADTSPPAASATTPSSPSQPATSPPAGTDSTPSAPASPQLYVLGPTGYGALQLGQSQEQAIATDLLEVRGVGEGCNMEAYLVGAPPSDDAQRGRVYFDNDLLVEIYAIPGVHTPEGIELGSSYAALHAAYPTWTSITNPGQPNGRGFAAVPGNANARYRIVVSAATGTVSQLSVATKVQHCYE